VFIPSASDTLPKNHHCLLEHVIRVLLAPTVAQDIGRDNGAVFFIEFDQHLFLPLPEAVQEPRIPVKIEQR
jgi:hypothetical protein